MPFQDRPRLRLARVLALAATALSPLSAHAALAQVAAPAQPDAASQQLSEALRALARDPRSLTALLAAAEASLSLDDAGAAAGFVQRAEALAPNDGRVMAARASLLARQQRPLDALGLFAVAEQQGGLSLGYLAERGLAYDLIGDNARAQQDYTLALAAGPDPRVTRRLALSQAIAGNQNASEATLLPLLQRSDLAAYRTRAFALAILGKTEEAVSIAETMLSPQLSGRLAPYLRYMPRLTRAQQAAAGNLGSFPQAAQIGRDDPALAAYVSGNAPAVTARSADSRLVPSGPPLGAAATPAPTPAATPAPARREGGVRRREDRAPAQVAIAPGRTPVPAPTPPPAPTPTPTSVPAARQTGPVPTPAAAPAPSPPRAPAQTVVAANSPALPAAQYGPPAAAGSGEALPPPVVVAIAAPSPSPSPPPVVVAIAAPPPAPSPAPAPPPTEPPPSPASLAEAFADLARPAAGASASPAPSATGAVDITRIQPRREVARPETPPARPAPPAHPARQWVQVATGRDTSALAFDWRRLKREAGGALDRSSPFTARWGQTNRLVVGPFATTREADAFVTRLKDKKIDSFRFSSGAGEEVKPLG